MSTAAAAVPDEEVVPAVTPGGITEAIVPAVKGFWTFPSTLGKALVIDVVEGRDDANDEIEGVPDAAPARACAAPGAIDDAA